METREKVGITASTTKALLSPKELASPGFANVNTALLPTSSLIVPLFKAKELLLT